MKRTHQKRSFLVFSMALLSLLFWTVPLQGAPLHSAAEPDYPPFSLVNSAGEADGFAVELLAATADAMGLTIEFKTAPWNQIKGELAEGELDVLPLVGRTPERETIYDFSIPYLTLHGALFVREDEAMIQNITDLSGKRIAVMKGDNAEEYVRRAALSDQIITTPTFEDAFRMLADGKADAVVAQKLMGISLLESLHIHTLKVVGKPNKEFKQTFSFAVKKGDSALLAKLNEGLAILNANGRAQHLYKKWMGILGIEGARSRILIYAGDHAYPPYEFLDPKGRPSGFNIDLLRALSRQTGIEFSFQLGPWNQVLEKARDGELDLMAMNYSESRASKMDFSAPIQPTSFSIFSRKNAPAYTGFEQLKTGRISVQNGGLLHDFALQNGLENNLITTTDAEEALKLLADGEVDFALGALVQGHHWIQKNGWKKLRVVDPKLVETDYCLCTPKGPSDLINLINTGLLELKASGEYRRIYNEWMAPLAPTAEWHWIRNWIYIGLASALLLSTVAALWIFLLQRQVRKHTVALQSANQRFNSAAQAGGIGVWDLDLINNQLVWDDRMYETYGVSKKEFGGAYEAWKQCVHPDDLDAAAAETTAAVEGKKKYNTIFRIVRPDGEIRQIQAHGNIFCGKNGRPEHMVGTNQDITAKKEIEEELKESQEKYKALYDNAPLSYQSLNEDGCILDINPTWLRLLGYERNEVVGAWFGDFLHPDYKPHFEKNFPAFKACGFVSDMQFKIRHKDGHYLTISFEGCAGYHPDGSFKQTYCVFQDITERKQSEVALRQSEERFRLLTGSIAAVVWITDERGEFIEPQEEWEAYTGQPWEEHRGQGWAKAIHPDDREGVGERWESAVSEIKPLESVGRIWHAATNDYHYFEARAVPLLNSDGSVREWIGTVIDINDRKQAEKKLKDSARHLKLAQSTASIGSWEQDGGSDKLIWSNMAYKLFGLDPKEDALTVDQFSAMVHPDDYQRVGDAFQASLEVGAPPYNITHRIVRVDTGEIRHLQERCTHFRDANGNVIKSIGTVQDITERKQTEKALKESEEKFASAFNKSPITLAITDFETGERIAVNDKFVETFGYSRADLLSDPFSKKNLAVDQRELMDAVEQLKRDGFLQDYPFQMVAKNGDVRDLLVSAARINSEYTHQYIISNIDITDQKKTAEKLERHQKNLESEVRERTKELRQTVNLMAGREVRMAELKSEIKQLHAQLEGAEMTPQDAGAKEIENTAPELQDGGTNEHSI